MYEAIIARLYRRQRSSDGESRPEIKDQTIKACSQLDEQQNTFCINEATIAFDDC
jgi:hypothetical protein